MDPENTASPGFFAGGQRFASQRGLVHFYRVAWQQARVGWNNVAQLQADDVARHQFLRRRISPFPVAFDFGFDRQLLPECGDRIARLVFFPESDDCVGQQQKQDDEEIRPVPDHAGQNHRAFDHPRNRAPEIGEEFQERIFFLFRDLVGPILSQPFFRLVLAQAVRRGAQLFLELLHGNRFQVFLRIDFAPGAARRLVSGLLRAFDSGFSVVGVMMPTCSVFLAIGRYTFASGGSATPPGGKNSGISRRATPIRLSAIP